MGHGSWATTACYAGGLATAQKGSRSSCRADLLFRKCDQIDILCLGNLCMLGDFCPAYMHARFPGSLAGTQHLIVCASLLLLEPP